MRHTRIYCTAAALAVGLFYLILELFPGKASYQYLFLPMVGFSALASASTSALLVLRIGWLPHRSTDERTGIVRGAIVVGVAHLLFGFYFFVAMEFDSFIDSFSGQYSGSNSSVLEEILGMSLISLAALPVTLLAGCVAGIRAEKKSGQHSSSG